MFTPNLVFTPSLDNQEWEAMELRLEVHNLFYKWFGVRDQGYYHLTALLGSYPNASKLETLKLLVGPHGRTIYEVLRAKNEVKIPVKS